MTAKKVREEVKRLTYIHHNLNYFYFDRYLTFVEIEAMKKLFPKCKFSNRLSKSGNVFLAKPNDKFVRWMLDYQHLEKYISKHWGKFVNGYDNTEEE